MSVVLCVRPFRAALFPRGGMSIFCGLMEKLPLLSKVLKNVAWLWNASPVVKSTVSCAIRLTARNFPSLSPHTGASGKPVKVDVSLHFYLTLHVSLVNIPILSRLFLPLVPYVFLSFKYQIRYIYEEYHTNNNMDADIWIACLDQLAGYRMGGV